MKNEVWKDIPGYEGLYLVSSLGRIKGIYKQVNGYVYSYKRGW